MGNEVNVETPKMVDEIWPGAQGFRVYKITPVGGGANIGWVVSIDNGPSWLNALGWSDTTEYWNFNSGSAPTQFDVRPMDSETGIAWLKANTPPAGCGYPLRKFAATATVVISETTVFKVEKVTSSGVGNILGYYTTNVASSSSSAWAVAGYPNSYLTVTNSQLLRFTQTTSIPTAMVRPTVLASA